MKSFAIAIFLLLSATAVSADELCIGPGCQRTAKFTDWPDQLEPSRFDIIFHQFSMNLPAPARRVAASGDMLLVATQNGSDFVFDIVAANDYATSEHPQGIHGGSRYSVASMAQIPFLHTADTSVPESEADRRVWWDAMQFKSEVFGKDNPVLRIARGDLEVFFYRSSAEPLGNYALLFDHRQPDRYVHLSAKGISFDELKNVIGSLELR